MAGMELLLELQDRDSTIDRLRARLAGLEAGTAVAKARADADAAEAELGEIRLRIDVVARDQQKLEFEIDSMTRKEKAEQGRMYDGSIANPKELESLQREVDSLQRRRTLREDELLALMEVREGLDGADSEAAKRSEEMRRLLDETSERTSAELAEIAADLAAVEAARDSIAGQVDPEVLELYEDLRPQKKGVAAVALVDGVCQGCHEQLSAMELDRLRKAEGVKRCEHCRRILVT